MYILIIIIIFKKHEVPKSVQGGLWCPTFLKAVNVQPHAFKTPIGIVSTARAIRGAYVQLLILWPVLVYKEFFGIASVLVPLEPTVSPLSLYSVELLPILDNRWVPLLYFPRRKYREKEITVCLRSKNLARPKKSPSPQRPS